MTVEEFSERHADFLHYYTNYLRSGEVLNLAKKHKLRASFKYTQEYYLGKLSAVFGRKPVYKYPMPRSGLTDWLAVFFLKYVSSITLFLEKKETYILKK